MRIGLVAPPFLEVPPAGYGGTELVVDTLARGLQAAGHEVRLFTVGDSTCPVPRGWWYEHPVVPIGLGEAEVAHVTAAYAELTDVDVIHDHTLVGPLAFAGRGVPPVVTTCHSRFSADLRPAYEQIARYAKVVAISQSQRDSAPTVPVAAVIHHGIDLARYEVGPGCGGYLLFLARMCADKGPHHAIRIARAAGRRLVLVAKMREAAEVAFFTTEVEPLLGTDVEVVGELGPAERIRLLGRADALLNPIEWPEPFGLTMIEALACGTPVLTLRHGAAPEIVTDGRTGFVRDRPAELVDCVSRLVSLDRAECRAQAERRFSMARMTADYVRVYEQALSGFGGGTSRATWTLPEAGAA